MQGTLISQCFHSKKVPFVKGCADEAIVHSFVTNLILLFSFLISGKRLTALLEDCKFLSQSQPDRSCYQQHSLSQYFDPPRGHFCSCFVYFVFVLFGIIFSVWKITKIWHQLIFQHCRDARAHAMNEHH